MRSPQQILSEIQEKNLNKPVKRISWEEKWLGHAYLTSMRSMDARTKCGCVLVKDNCLVSEGYNSFIRDISDDKMPNFEGNEDSTLCKYNYIKHAEDNALLNASRNGYATLGSLAYITTTPCVKCYQSLYQAGIETIIIPKNPKYIPSFNKTEKYKEQMEFLQFLTNNQLPIISVECTINIDV